MQYNISEGENIFGLSEFTAGSLAGGLILLPTLLHIQANPPAIRDTHSGGREDSETAGPRQSDSIMLPMAGCAPQVLGELRLRQH